MGHRIKINIPNSKLSLLTNWKHEDDVMSFLKRVLKKWDFSRSEDSPDNLISLILMMKGIENNKRGLKKIDPFDPAWYYMIIRKSEYPHDLEIDINLKGEINLYERLTIKKRKFVKKTIVVSKKSK